MTIPPSRNTKKILGLAEKDSRALKTTFALTSSLLSALPMTSLHQPPALPMRAPRPPPTKHGERGGREGSGRARGVSCRMDSPSRRQPMIPSHVNGRKWSVCMSSDPDLSLFPLEPAGLEFFLSSS